MKHRISSISLTVTTLQMMTGPLGQPKKFILTLTLSKLSDYNTENTRNLLNICLKSKFALIDS